MKNLIKNKLFLSLTVVLFVLISILCISLFIWNPTCANSQTPLAVNEKSFDSKLQAEDSLSDSKQTSSPTSLGVFESSDELKDFINLYYDLLFSGRKVTDMIADSMTLDYGKPQKFARDAYVEMELKHLDKNKITSSRIDIDWDAMSFDTDGKEGIIVSYPGIYTRTINNKGKTSEQKFKLKTEVSINSEKKIYKYKERASRIN